MVDSPVGEQRVKSGRRKIAWFLLLLVVGMAFATVFIPLWLIMPFKAQTARGLALSYAFKSWAPVVTMIAVVLALTLCVRLWQGGRWYGRIAMIIVLIPAIVAAWFARQNHFEWMFNPLPSPAYVRISEVNFMNDREMVMSILINGEAVAYPVRQMAYHHVVQDVVGGVPIVATY